MHGLVVDFREFNLVFKRPVLHVFWLRPGEVWLLNFLLARAELSTGQDGRELQAVHQLLLLEDEGLELLLLLLHEVIVVDDYLLDVCLS